MTAPEPDYAALALRLGDAAGHLEFDITCHGLQYHPHLGCYTAVSGDKQFLLIPDEESE